MKTGRKRKLKRAAPGRGNSGGKATEESAGQLLLSSSRAGPGAGREDGVTEQWCRARPQRGEGRARAAWAGEGGGVAVKIRHPNLPAYCPGVPRVHTCTNTRLSAGTSSGPARRGKASSASDSSRLKSGRRSQDPGAAGNGGAAEGEGEKGWHRRGRMRCPLGSRANDSTSSPPLDVVEDSLKLGSMLRSLSGSRRLMCPPGDPWDITAQHKAVCLSGGAPLQEPQFLPSSE